MPRVFWLYLAIAVAVGVAAALPDASGAAEQQAKAAVDPIKPGTGWKVQPTKTAYQSGRSIPNVVD